MGRGVLGAAVVAVACLGLAVGARAGQFTVVTCQWPGANGQNNSWRENLGAVNAPPQPTAYQFIVQ